MLGGEGEEPRVRYRQSIRLCVCHYRDEHKPCKFSDMLRREQLLFRKQQNSPVWEGPEVSYQTTN